MLVVVVRSLPQHLRVEPLSSRWRPKLDPPRPSASPKEKASSTFYEPRGFPEQRGVGPRSYPGDALLPPPAAGCPRCPY